MQQGVSVLFTGVACTEQWKSSRVWARGKGVLSLGRLMQLEGMGSGLDLWEQNLGVGPFIHLAGRSLTRSSCLLWPALKQLKSDTE